MYTRWMRSTTTTNFLGAVLFPPFTNSLLDEKGHRIEYTHTELHLEYNGNLLNRFSPNKTIHLRFALVGCGPSCFFHFSFTSLCILSHRILIYLYCKVLDSKWVCGFYLLVCTRRWHRLALLFTELLRWASCASFGRCAREVFPTSTAAVAVVVVFIFVIV